MCLAKLSVVRSYRRTTRAGGRAAPSRVTVTSMSSFRLVFMLLPARRTEMLHFSKLLIHKAQLHKFTRSRLNSLSAIKAIIRETQENMFLLKEKLSQ